MGQDAELEGHGLAIRVYIADDESGIRYLLKKAVDHAGMLGRTFENGLEVLEAMQAKTRFHAVLMLSSHGDVATAVRAIRAGAIDFIEKPVSLSVLLERIRQLHQMIEEWQGDRQLRTDVRHRLDHLTEREREVGTQLALGLSNKEIARKFDISPRTVEAHRARLMQKLGVSSLAEVVRLFVQS